MVGPWGDCSKDLHALIKVMGDTKVAAMAKERGDSCRSQIPGIVLKLQKIS